MAAYQLGVIGGGKMAEAILRAVVGRAVLNHNVILVSEPRRPRRQLLLRDLQVTCVADNRLAAACPHVLLAVKPQVMADVLDGVAASVRDDAVVISIAAGISTKFLDGWLGGKGHVVRAVPNAALGVGAGLTAVAAGPRATGADLHWAGNLFAACGKVFRVGEDLIDAVAVLAGSGLALFFYLIEAMVSAGVAEGLDADEAAGLAAGSCAGAARLLAETDEPPEGLRARITRPGGATQQAIESLEAAGVKRGLVEAIRAAARRSRDLEQ